MDKLKVTTSDLRDIADSLLAIGTEFQDANENSAALADAVGHHELGDKIKDFAENWDVRRKDFVDKISKLQQNVQKGADNFEHTDQQLADEVTGNDQGGN